MKHVCFIAVAAILALVCFSACAHNEDLSTTQLIKNEAPEGISDTFFDCVQEADDNSDSHALSVCISEERSAQENRLNALYQSALGTLNAQDRKDLIRIQRSWLEFNNKTEGIDEFFLTKDSPSGNFGVSRREAFRMCRRANDLALYISLAKNAHAPHGSKKGVKP